MRYHIFIAVVTHLTSASLLMGLKQDGTRREFAWAEFRHKYAPIIAGFARNLGVPQQEIDDIIQDVLTGFYSAQPTFKYDPSIGRFCGYLKTCVIRLLARRHAKHLPLDGRPIDQIDPAIANPMDEAWEKAWEQQQLHTALEMVRQHYQDSATFRAFHRVAIEGQEPQAVADDLQMSLNAVHQARSRCTSRLRSMVRQLADEE